MHNDRCWLVRFFVAVFFVTAFAVPQTLSAQSSSHLVSPSDLQKATVDASQTRQQNLDTLNGFLNSAQAQQAMQSAHVDPQQVKQAVTGLSDQDMAQLASKAQKGKRDSLTLPRAPSATQGCCFSSWPSSQSS
jgi:hypothetical protein